MSSSTQQTNQEPDPANIASLNNLLDALSARPLDHLRELQRGGIGNPGASFEVLLIGGVPREIMGLSKYEVSEVNECEASEPPSAEQ